MRHKLAYRKLNRTSEHRKALFTNMLNSLIKYEQITTTLPKAKELKPKIDKVITLGKKNNLQSKKNLFSKLQDKSSVDKLIKTLSQRYEKRKGDLPSPGQNVESFQTARKFSDKFDILAIEIIANSAGMYDLSVGHPSTTSSISKSFGTNATKDVGKHKTMIISTGKESSNNTLSKSLSSLWNCSDAIRNDGLAILLAECKLGIGSDGIQSFIDGRINLDYLKKPSQYIDNMENLLYITEIQKKFQIGLLSILPTHYTKKLNMISFNGIKQAMDYVLKNQGQKQKVEVISDGARTILRQDS